MQNSHPVLFLGLGMVMAFITSILGYSWLVKQPKLAPVVSVPMETVVVASGELYWGTKLTEPMLKLVSFPQSSLPPGYFSTLEAATGRVLVANLTTNEPLLESKLAPLTVTVGGVAAVTNPDKRAMAVRVDEVIGVAGFINPGNRVDVVATLHPAGSEPITKVVLQNVLVLATGTEVERRGKEEKPSVVKVITLEVTPEEAEKLALAANDGKLRLALRNQLNAEPVLTPGATIPSLLAPSKAPEVMHTVAQAFNGAARPGERPPDSPKPAEIYSWHDDRGVVHMTNQWANVPEPMRSRVRVHKRGTPSVTMQQTLNPEAAHNVEPVTGFDGVAAQAAIETYRKSFEKPSAPPPFILSVGQSK